MPEQENRTYYLKAYASWWAAMAFLGSLIVNGPSKTFLGAGYNSAAWSGAALSALFIAALHTHYRDSIRRAVNHPLAFWLGIFGFLALQITNLWERQATRPNLFYGVLPGILCCAALFLLIVCIAGVHETFSACRKRADLSPETP